MIIETIDDAQIDGHEPCETCQTVEDTSHLTLLTGETSQLTIGTIEEVGPHQEEDGSKVIKQTRPSLVVITATGKEEGCGCTDDNRPDGYGVRMDVEFGEEPCQLETERSDDVEVEPIFCLYGFV